LKFENETDLIKIIRSKRQHGFGLELILRRGLRTQAAKLAHSRPLRKAGKIVKEERALWEIQDCIDNRDRILLAFINKAFNIDHKPKTNKVIEAIMPMYGK
jgi:hypothetical protein